MIEFDGRVGHLEGIQSPWGSAGGVVKSLGELAAMVPTGVGWVEAGSYTLERRVGLAVDPLQPELGPSRRVYVFNPETGETGNAFSMPNQGRDQLVKDIPEMQALADAFGVKLIVNVAPVSHYPVAEVRELVASVYSAGAEAVLLNGGCRNVDTPEGGREEPLSAHPQILWDVLTEITPIVEKHKPILFRPTPQESYAEAKQLYSVIRQSGVVSAVFVPNSWFPYVPRDRDGQPILEVPGGEGSLSGPATAEMSRQQTKWAVDLLAGSNIDIVSSSGIMNAPELKTRLDLKAKAGAGSTFYFESVDGWIDDTQRLITKLTELI